MADKILIPKDTPDWQAILSGVEQARDESEKFRDESETNAALTSGVDYVDDSLGDISSPSSGETALIFSNTEGKFYKYDGSSWNKIGPTVGSKVYFEVETVSELQSLKPGPNRIALVKGFNTLPGPGGFYWWDDGTDTSVIDGVTKIGSNVSGYGSNETNEGVWRLLDGIEVYGRTGQQERNPVYNANSGVGDSTDPFAGGLQDTIDEVEGSTEVKVGILRIRGDWDESIDIGGEWTITGGNFSTKLDASQDHTIDCQSSDVEIKDIWVNNRDDTGTYACINLGPETTLQNMDVEPQGSTTGPRTAILGQSANEVKIIGVNIQSYTGNPLAIEYINSSRVQIVNTGIQDGDLVLQGMERVEISNLQTEDEIRILSENESSRRINLSSVETQSDFIVTDLNNTDQRANGIVASALLVRGKTKLVHIWKSDIAGDFQGDLELGNGGLAINTTLRGHCRSNVLFDGASRCTFHGTIEGNIEFTTNSFKSIIYGSVEGDVTFASGSTQNKIYGNVNGTVTDNDGSNIVV